ncbi:MAG: SpoIIE family protein phosphatase [Spirochaetes bacterium]|nr:SpoIIE family protein phosphatase [Spirochaetota bacterium]
MNYILNILKIFLPLFGFIVIFAEEKREHNSTSKSLLTLFILMILKESIIQAVISFNSTILFTKFLPFYYIISFVPIFYLLIIISKFIFTEDTKPLKLIKVLFSLIILSLISIYIFQTEKYIIFPYVMLAVRLAVSAIIVYVIIRLNAHFFGDELNIIVKNRILINLTLIIYILHYVLYFASNSIVKNLAEIILYSFIVIIAYSRILEGYKKLDKNIEHLNYEREIFLTLLHKVGKGLTAEANFDTILELILNYSIEVIKCKAAALLLVSPNKKYLTAKYIHGLYPPTGMVEGYTATKEKFLMEKFKSEKIPVGETYLGSVAASGLPLLIPNALNSKHIIQTAKGLMDIRTLIVVPLKFKDEVIGVVSYCNKEEGGPFTADEFSLAQTLSEQAAITLNNFRLYNELLGKQRDERELEIAGEIQKNLLPKKIPKMHHVTIFAYNKAAKGVGGDYYDFMNFDNENLAAVMADVAGKGVPAALVMVMIRTTLHNILKPNLKPSSILNYLNKFLSVESTKDRYATMYYFLLNVKTKKLIYSNAAHGPMLLYRQIEDKFHLLDTEGLPVGISEDQKYNQGEVTLKTGDIIMLYTDGITEAMNEKRDQFSLDKVKKIIQNNKNKSAEDIGKSITKEIDEFVGEAEQHDDQTLILLKIT